MEKRKWLWKRKSSEKSPGETESSSSISSHSERYSDDREAFKSSPNHNAQSPEVTSKAIIASAEDVNDSSSNTTIAVASAEDVNDGASKKEDVNDSVKILTERLSAALVNVSAKEDLVKQHAKVAEEAVAGWENAENEVVVLKQQLESAVEQNSVLEDRVTHLDGALKELVRQLRQSRDEQEQKIHEAVVKKASEWETTKLKLESQLVELQSKAEDGKSESPIHVDPDLCDKLESLEIENSALKLELQAQSEELEIRTIERDLSTQTAETASKQHLEGIKKVARLEAECRRLRSMTCKSSLINGHKSTTASSVCVDSLTDSQSDSGERLSLVEINTRKVSSSEPKCDPSCSDSWASALIAELDQFKNEKTVKRNLPASSIQIDLMDDFLEMEQLAALPVTKSGSPHLESEVSSESNNGESCLRTELEAMIRQTAELEEKIEKTEAEKAELETALIKSQEYMEASQLELREAEIQLEELRRELNIAKESKQVVESRLISMEAEARTMSEKVESLEIEVEKERTLSAEIAGKCRELEEELSIKKQEVELQKTASSNGKLKLISMEAEARTMSEKVESLEIEVEKERTLSAEITGKCRELEEELSIKKQQVELQKIASSNGELKLISMEAEARTMSEKVESLEIEVEKERTLSAEITGKCRELEEELSIKKQEVELQKTASSNGELKIKQEDLAVAAGKLAECQKTIASLGNQLKSLATLEDFLIETADLPEFSAGASLIPRAEGEPWKTHSNETFSPKRDSGSRMADETSVPSVNRNEDSSLPSSSSSSSDVVSIHVNSEKNRNGFAKFFSRTKSGIRLEI